MPLAFKSRSHGTLAFGFFNIESDMLLLENLFFFADKFCSAVVALAESQQATIQGWRLPRGSIGNLHGAIAGVDLSGFIGATYELFPFPNRPEGFKQSPLGQQSQKQVIGLIDPLGQPESLQLRWDRATNVLELSEYVFDEAGFAELVAYVERGGYPRYKDEQRPTYVRAMIERLGDSVLASVVE